MQKKDPPQARAANFEILLKSKYDRHGDLRIYLRKKRNLEAITRGSFLEGLAVKKDGGESLNRETIRKTNLA